VPARPLTDDDRRRVTDRVRAHLGPVEIEIEEVDRIERDVAGKFRAVVSKVES
jgi:hypothetical protein